MDELKRYSELDKERMRKLYAITKSCQVVADVFDCANSTVYYATHPEAYERHKEHVREMRMFILGIRR